MKQKDKNSCDSDDGKNDFAKCRVNRQKKEKKNTFHALRLHYSFSCIICDMFSETEFHKKANKQMVCIF